MSKSKSIDHCAEALAREISTRSIFDIAEVKLLIAVRFDDALQDFLKEQSSEAEREYQKVVHQQSKLRVGSADYITLGYQLNQLKYKLKSANRAMNEMNKDHKFLLFRSFITAKFGEGVFEEFLQSEEMVRFEQSLTVKTS